MPRHRKKNGIFDSRGLPKPIIEAVQTTARTTASAGTRPALEYQTTPKQHPIQNGRTLTQSTLMPEPTHGLTYALCQRSDSLDHISALKRTCKSMARYRGENPVSSFSQALNINSDETFIMRLGKRVMFMQPIAAYPRQTLGKTYGFIRFERGEVKFKAESGWGKGSNCDEGLWDNEFWSSQVLQFCNSLGFKLPGHCWDQTEVGRYAACHVEKKLILMLICDLIYDVETGDIAMFRLEELWDRRLRAQIYLDKDPCNGCRNFAYELEYVTGIHFEIITSKTVVEAEWVKENGKKRLRAKHTAQAVHSQLNFSTSKTKRPKKQVDYNIPEIPTSWKSKSGGKRKRRLEEGDETFVPEYLQPKAKRLHEKLRKPDKVNKAKSSSMTYRLGKPTPTYNAPKDLTSNTSHSLLPRQQNTTVGVNSARLVSSLGSLKSAKDCLAIKGNNLPKNGHAVPSERSRAIAELQKAKKGLLSRPVGHNPPLFHGVPSPSSISRTEVYKNSDDSDAISLRSSRTALPDGFAIIPPSRAAKALPTPETTPLRRYTESLYSERFSVEESVTRSRSAHNSYKPTPTKSAGPVSRPSKRVNSRSIDLTTPEPSPFLKIKQYQYTPPFIDGRNE
ncbi:hypothetical protein NHQ30_001564 [Ciborinia camelliae]|nr:hypothetical protein NHQ30_001564 [Ciborinia camelliae]